MLFLYPTFLKNILIFFIITFLLTVINQKILARTSEMTQKLLISPMVTNSLKLRSSLEFDEGPIEKFKNVSIRLNIELIFIYGLFYAAEPQIPMEVETPYRRALLQNYNSTYFTEYYLYPTLNWLSENLDYRGTRRFIFLTHLSRWYLKAKQKQMGISTQSAISDPKDFMEVDCTLTCLESIITESAKGAVATVGAGATITGGITNLSPPATIGLGLAGGTVGLGWGAIKCIECQNKEASDLAKERQIAMEREEMQRAVQNLKDQMNVLIQFSMGKTPPHELSTPKFHE